MFSRKDQMLAPLALMSPGNQDSAEKRGGGNVNPRPPRQNRAADFDLPHAKNTVIFQRAATASVILD